ncbi:MAG: hypothetical protein LBT91_01680 [Bifidobacteriaceae bacterium]|jgi:hypothetical protein|nr:hypothetical protein [Bifidobacteriaceae bacterium]
MKTIKFKKFGIQGIIFFWAVLGFSSGWQIKGFFEAYASTPTTILPISKGGTNSTTPGSASNNILGNNWENYSGVLPIAKGGTGTNFSPKSILNLGGTMSLTYTQPGSSETYFKIYTINVAVAPVYTTSLGSTKTEPNTALARVAGMADISDNAVFSDLVSLNGYNGWTKITHHNTRAKQMKYFYTYDANSALLNVYGKFSSTTTNAYITVQYLLRGSYLMSNPPRAEMTTNLESPTEITDVQNAIIS